MSQLSKLETLLLKDFKKREKVGTHEAIDILIANYYLLDLSSLQKVRERIKMRVSRGIDKHYLLELTMLHSYLEHLINIYL